jgi:hypothetical protein
MRDMSNNNKEMDALMMAIIMHELLNKKEKDLKVSPFTVAIELTPNSISCHTEGNKALIADLGAEEWLKETQKKIEPIMSEQTTKFAELFAKKIGCEFQDGKTSGFADFLKEVFGVGSEDVGE